MNSDRQTERRIDSWVTDVISAARPHSLCGLCGLCGLQEWRHEHDSHRRPWCCRVCLWVYWGPLRHERRQTDRQTDRRIDSWVNVWRHSCSPHSLGRLLKWRHEHESHRRPWSWKQTYRFTYRRSDLGKQAGGVWGGGTILRPITLAEIVRPLPRYDEFWAYSGDLCFICHRILLSQSDVSDTTCVT